MTPESTRYVFHIDDDWSPGREGFGGNPEHGGAALAERTKLRGFAQYTEV